MQTALPLEWEDGPPVYGRSFLRMGWCSFRDEVLLTHWISDFARAGCPDTNRVPLTLAAAARILGARSVGQPQRDAIRQALLRLRSVSVQMTARVRGGEETVGFGLVHRYRISSRGSRSQGWVELDGDLANLIRRGRLTLFDLATLDRLLQRDEYAARLFLFLETESFDRWVYHLWSAPPGHADREHNMPPLTQLLRVRDRQRRRVARRIAQALAVVCEEAPVYECRVKRTGEPGMWSAHVARRAGDGRRQGQVTVPSGAGDGRRQGQVTVPSGAGDGRRHARNSALPLGPLVHPLGEPSVVAPDDRQTPWEDFSPRQRRVVDDIRREHDAAGDSTWAAVTLRDVADEPDPWAAFMYRHREWRDRRRLELRVFGLAGRPPGDDRLQYDRKVRRAGDRLDAVDVDGMTDAELAEIDRAAEGPQALERQADSASDVPVALDPAPSLQVLRDPAASPDAKRVARRTLERFAPAALAELGELEVEGPHTSSRPAQT